MAVAVDSSFDSWLATKLESLEIDEGVFGSYIKGILEGDESEEEKISGIESILTGATENNIGSHVSEIISNWNSSTEKVNEEVPAPAEDVDVRLIKMLESQNLQTLTQRSYTAEERQIRDAILAQYGQTSVDNESDEDCGGCGGCPGSDDENKTNGDSKIEKNTNAFSIVQQEKEKREKARLESQKKKEKDKEDREKQKQLKEEKKEKRKTQKGERRR